MEGRSVARSEKEEEVAKEKSYAVNRVRAREDPIKPHNRSIRRIASALLSDVIAP